jgi:hypothetical protein
LAVKQLDPWIDTPRLTKKGQINSKQSGKVTVAGERNVIVGADRSAYLDGFGKAFTRELVDRGKRMLELCREDEQLEHGAND